MAYLAKSVLLWYCDWAKPCQAHKEYRQIDKPIWSLRVTSARV
jgi:hypothetical protein